MTQKFVNPMRYIIFLAFAVMLAACQSEKVAPKHIFADYFVRYLETERQLKVHAAFYEGDTLETARSLVFDKNVTFQGYEMNPRQIENKTMRYIFNGIGDYDSSFLFQYTDLRGKPQEFRITMAPLRDFSVKNNEISLSKGMVLELEGEPFAANESLILLFTSERNKSAMAEFKGPFNVKTLEVPAVQLMDVDPGKNFLYLVKKQENIQKTSTMDITSSVEYYSKTIEIQVLE